MKFLVQKLDYELYNLIFKENNLDAAIDIWQSIVDNEAFLKAAMQIGELDNKKCFVAPTIVFLILNNPSLVKEDVYLSLIDIIFNNLDMVLNVSYNNFNFDYILMILRNNSLKLSAKNKQRLISHIFRLANLNNDTDCILYGKLVSGGENVATFKNGKTAINLDEFECRILSSNGQINIIKQKLLLSRLREYYYAIFSNPNFIDVEKEIILKKIQNIYLLANALESADEMEITTTKLAI